MRRRQVAGLALAGTLVLAGCGSNGTSKADYIKQADAICARANATITAIPRPNLTTAATPAEQARVFSALSTYVDRITPPLQQTVSQLKALKQPSADKALLKRYFAALDQAIAELHQVSAAAHKGDVSGVRAGALALQNTQPDALARQYGFKRCGGTVGP